MRVRCIKTDDATLPVGQIYEVVSETTTLYYLKDKNGNGWFKWRFEVVEEDEAPTQVVEASTQTTVQPEPPFDFDSYNGVKRR